MSANDRQEGGNHYREAAAGGAQQHWDRAWSLYREAWFVLNITKYVERYRRKDGVKDLLKARHYLDKLIELEQAAGKVEQTRRLRPLRPCPDCQARSNKDAPCPNCLGTGWIPCEPGPLEEPLAETVACPGCGGRCTSLNGDTCLVCKGRGTIQVHTTHASPQPAITFPQEQAPGLPRSQINSKETD